MIFIQSEVRSSTHFKWFRVNLTDIRSGCIHTSDSEGIIEAYVDARMRTKLSVHLNLKGGRPATSSERYTFVISIRPPS